jgi:hypothetical protein
MNYCVFDIEVFPSFTCIVGHDKDGYFVYRSDAGSGLTSWFKRATTNNMLVGFNSVSYDSVILAWMLEERRNPYKLSKAIISGDRDYVQKNRKWLPYGTLHYDVFNNKGVFLARSLKEVQMLERWDVCESSVPFDKQDLSQEEKNEIIEYCKNDVLTTKKLFEKYCGGDLDARARALEQFGIPKQDWWRYLSKTPGGLAESLIGKVNGDAVMDLQRLKPLVSPLLHETIDYCEQAGKLARDRRLLVDVVEIPQMGEVKIGTGGFHWARENYVFKGEKDGDVMNCDCDSMYPSLLSKFRYPTWSKKQYELWDSLIAVKRNPTIPKTAKAGAKLVLNSLSGKFADRYSTAFCPTANLEMCVTGQILILDLAITFHNCGCELIQVNTDAVMFHPHGDWESAKTAWEQRTGLILGDGEKYKSIYQRDVNNYIATTEDPKGFKCKGEYFKGSGLPGAKAWGKEPHVVTRMLAKHVLGDEFPELEEMPMTPEHTLAGEKRAKTVKKYDGFVPKSWKVFYHDGQKASQKCDFVPDRKFLNERFRVLMARWESKKWERIGKSEAYYQKALSYFSVLENPWAGTKEIPELPDTWELMLKSLSEAGKLPEQDFLNWLSCVDDGGIKKKARTAYYGMTPVSPRALAYTQTWAGVNQKRWNDYTNWEFFDIADSGDWKKPEHDQIRAKLILEWWTSHKGYCPSAEILNFYGGQFASMKTLTNYLKKRENQK